MTTKSQDPYYAAQDILSRREHSEFEVRTKMKRKRFSSTQIDDAVRKLKKLDLINDNNFSKVFVEQILNLKAVGPKWLTYKLKQRGIEQSIISYTIKEAFISGREAELAKQAVSIWKRTHPLHVEDYERLRRHLAARGFSFESINLSL